VKIKFLVLIVLVVFSCSSTDQVVQEETIRAADISFLPLLESENTVFKSNNQPEDVVSTLQKSGCNCIRIRLWRNPTDGHSGLNEVKAFANRVRQDGMKVWISVHFSDTWADPGNQTKPGAWQNLTFEELKSAVRNYTTQIIEEINPDIIQIGNETNDGMLWPEGRLSTSENRYLQLVAEASQAIRNSSSKAKIMLHFAGTNGADYYFNKVKSIDYDYIGLSYYPIWHGKNIETFKNTIDQLGATYNKKVLIAETAYPFTLGYNDFTNNILGQENQLISAYPATEIGQNNFLLALKTAIQESASGIGYCYWEPEWVAFRGLTSTNGSPWENQALWDFDNNALSGLEFFTKN